MQKWLLILTLTGAVLLQSCRTYRYVPYFKDVPDSARVAIKTALYSPLRIQPGDMLTISVLTIDAGANAVFNQTPSMVSNPAPSSAAMALQPTGSTYTVDRNGLIDLPLLGSFQTGGITTDSLRDTIRNKASAFYKTPSVTVRFANLKVSVLGEVARPGSYILTNEKNTILDALSMAGDLTVFGKRQNALLIRDSSGYTVMSRFSLNSKDLVQQDFYYLKQNDVIYVEADKGKAGAIDAYQSRIYAIAVSVISLIIVLASRIN